MNTDTWLYKVLDWIDVTARSLPIWTKLVVSCVFVEVCVLLFFAASNAGAIVGDLLK